MSPRPSDSPLRFAQGDSYFFIIGTAAVGNPFRPLMSVRAYWIVISLLPWALPAQVNRPSVTHQVHGVVYDSTTGGPLVGATVQALVIDSAGKPIVDGSRGTAFSAMTDSAGHFAVAGLPTGIVAFGFQHDALSAFGIETPLRVVRLNADTDVVLDLSIPPGPEVRARACRGSSLSDGLIVGYLTRGHGGSPLPKARVVVRWTELTLRRTKLQSVPHQASAIIGDDGRYQACGIPAEGPLSLEVSADGFYRLEMELVVPASGIIRRDARLAEIASVDSGASFKIRIVDDSAAVVTGGRVEVAGLGRTAVIENGEALMRGVPEGTWVLSVRSLGYQPRTVIVESGMNELEPTVVLSRGVHTLDPIVSTAKRAERDSAVFRDIEARMRIASGTLIRADNLAVINSSEASDAIRAARGFRWKGPADVEGRQDATGPCPGAKKRVAVYLNGDRVYGGLEMLNRMVPVKDILAIEAYPDVTSAPFLWRKNDTCAVVAFWTKH